jgi:hypothetical protein
MYLDIGETLTVRNLETTQYATVKFTKRGWVNQEQNAYKFEGHIFSEAQEEKLCKKD